MPSIKLEVLHQDNHLLAVWKPAGLATMGVAPHLPSLLSVAKEYVKERFHKPGNVYLGVVSRLDAPVTGVVLLARTSKAAARLTDQFRERTVEKVYWAVVRGAVEPADGVCVDWLVKDERHRRVHTAQTEQPGAQEARLKYRTLRRLGDDSLLEVTLETGRKHQIRVQLAGRGAPILGDRKYGGRAAFGPGVALHARRLVCRHPTRDEEVRLVAHLPASWRSLGVREEDG